MSVDRLQIKSTEASVRVPVLIATFPALQDLVSANIPGLQDLAGLTLIPDRYEDGRQDSAVVDDFCLYRGEQFVAYLRHFRRLHSNHPGQEATDYVGVGWKDNSGRLLRVDYDDMTGKKGLGLNEIDIFPLEGEAIVVGKKVASAASVRSLPIKEVFENVANLGTTIKIKRLIGLALPKQLCDSAETGIEVDSGKETLLLKGHAPFFHQPFSLKLPLSLSRS